MKFDQGHFDYVNAFVGRYNDSLSVDDFFNELLTKEDVRRAQKSLHFSKATGYGGMSAEQLFYAEDLMSEILCLAPSRVRVNEYIPKCFRVGV